MDLASLIGFIGAVGAIVATMIMGGGVAPFIDTQSIFIVFGGTFFCVMYQNPLPVFLGSFGAMSKAFLPPIKKMDETVERMVELAGMARKDGMMALEGQPVPDKFFEKGMQMLVDGADEQKLVKQMKSEIASMKDRHEANHSVVQASISKITTPSWYVTKESIIVLLLSTTVPNTNEISAIVGSDTSNKFLLPAPNDKSGWL